MGVISRVFVSIRCEAKRFLRGLGADAVLAAFLVFAATVTVVDDVAPRHIREWYLPHTGWVPSGPYMATLFFVVLALSSGHPAHRALAVIPFMIIQLAFGAHEWLTEGVRESTNTYLRQSAFRPLWTVVVPIAWIALLVLVKPKPREIAPWAQRRDANPDVGAPPSQLIRVFCGPEGGVVEPTDWFRVRHQEPFPDEVVAAFRASCAIYRAKMAALLQHWDELALVREGPRPTVFFLEPEVSEDRRVMSLPVRIENKTLGSRSLFQSTASSDLYSYLPFSVIPDIEVGLTESAFEGPGWRHDWWSPHRSTSIPPEEPFRRLGFTIRPDPEQPGRAFLVPGWRRRMQWFASGLLRKLKGRRTTGCT